MVAYAQAVQISFIGGALIFAYIASTIKLNERFDNSIRLLFYFFSLLMVLASTGINYPIIRGSTDATLLNDTNFGGILSGVFIGQLSVLIFLFLTVIILLIVAIVMSLRLKNLKKKYGEDYNE